MQQPPRPTSFRCGWESGHNTLPPCQVSHGPCCRLPPDQAPFCLYSVANLPTAHRSWVPWHGDHKCFVLFHYVFIFCIPIFFSLWNMYSCTYVLNIHVSCIIVSLNIISVYGIFIHSYSFIGKTFSQIFFSDHKNSGLLPVLRPDEVQQLPVPGAPLCIIVTFGISLAPPDLPAVGGDLDHGVA